MIEFKNVTKEFRGGKIAVDDVSVTFDKGEFICIIGTSGSGKTTTMRMLNRMIEPTKGDILLDGKNIKERDPVELRREIGYVIQNIGLMDEPFGALDPITRESLQDLVKQLQVEMGKSIVFVTHDMDEALKLANRIMVMSEGKVIQFDTPSNILKNPANEFVESMVGEERLIQARQEETSVSQIMSTNVVSITPEKSLSDGISLMREKRVDTLFVTDGNGILKGIVDVQDINRHRRQATSIGDILNTDVFYIHQDSLLRDSVQRILKRGFKNIPVVNDQRKLVGIVTRAALVDMVYDVVWGDEEEFKAQEETVEQEVE